MSRRRTIQTIVCLVVLWLAMPAQACSIPVFRFALERWESDLYEIDVFYRGELSTDDRRRVDLLDERCRRNGGQANAEVVRCDVAETLEAELAEVWQSLADVSLPCVVVRMPAHRQPSQALPGGRGIVWHGSISDAAAAPLFDSPARRELCRRLLAGDSVVWLVVGDSADTATQQASQLLEELLPRLAEEIPLPPGVGGPGSELASEIPLSVKFSQLEVNAADAKEVLVVQAVTSRAPKSAVSGEPLVAAVFGRGRVVEVFRAAELEEQLVADVSRFLCGACSCQVKDLNPGFDLLTSTLWDEQLFAVGQKPAGIAALPASLSVDAAAAQVPIPEGPPKVGTPAADRLPGAETIASDAHISAHAAGDVPTASSFPAQLPWVLATVGVAISLGLAVWRIFV